MRFACFLLLGLCAWSPRLAEAEPAIDQLLESVAPLLDAGEEYHTPAVPGDTPEPITLTVDRCVAMALEQNTETLIAETDVALRQAQAGLARARRLPQARAEAAYHYIEELDINIGGGLLGGFVDTESFSADKETVTTRLSITQILFAGGQIHSAVKASRFLADSQEWRRDAVRAEVAFQARRAYYDALLARAAAAVAEEALHAFERHLNDTEILEKEGVLTAFEVMRARTEVSARKADLVSARAAVDLADLAVRRILALPENQPLAYDAVIAWTPVDFGSDLIGAAREDRPEIRALRDAVAAAEQQERGVRGKYLPQASAAVTWVEVDGGGQSSPDGWQVNIGAQWDLYLGGQRKHERAEARARAEAIRLQLADMERQVALEVERARIELAEAAAAAQAGRENVLLAEESVRLAKIRYREGIGTQTEILDTELEQARARAALVKAARDCHVARAALDRASGRPLEVTLGEE